MAGIARTWFTNVTFLCTDNSITTTHTHHGNNHSARDNHEGVLIVRSRVVGKCKLTMELRVRITVDSGVDIVLAVPRNIFWSSLRSESTTLCIVLVHSLRLRDADELGDERKQ